MTKLSLVQNSTQNVSRERFLTLEKYVALLVKWNKAINLVGKSTEVEIWQRHIADSLQLSPLIPPHVKTVADFGSGAGLPGLVLAIAHPAIHFTMVEQDQRKAAFIQEAIGLLELSNARVMNADIACVSARFDLITARALAPLTDLFAMAYPRMEEGASCLFPKGRNFANEVAEAQKKWDFTHTLTQSKTEDKASIILITKLSASNPK